MCCTDAYDFFSCTQDWLHGNHANSQDYECARPVVHPVGFLGRRDRPAFFCVAIAVAAHVDRPGWRRRLVWALGGVLQKVRRSRRRSW